MEVIHDKYLGYDLLEKSDCTKWYLEQLEFVFVLSREWLRHKYHDDARQETRTKHYLWNNLTNFGRRSHFDIAMAWGNLQNILVFHEKPSQLMLCGLASWPWDFGRQYNFWHIFSCHWKLYENKAFYRPSPVVDIGALSREI